MTQSAHLLSLLLTMAAATATLGGCGLKGDLYLPEDDSEAVAEPSSEQPSPLPDAGTNATRSATP